MRLRYYLGRALVVPVMGVPGAAFFESPAWPRA